MRLIKTTFNEQLPVVQEFFDKAVPGFIYHPKAIPFTLKKRRRTVESSPEMEKERSNLGLCFHTEKYFKPGILVEFTVMIRDDVQTFTGRVVFNRETEEGYVTGIWLLSQSDAYRARIVEQVCHIDRYLEKKQGDKQTIDTEREAGYWISRFAARFPV